MKVQESLTIYFSGPEGRDAIVATLRARRMPCDEVEDAVLYLGPFERGRFEDLRQELASADPGADVRRSVFPVYSKRDHELADFVPLNFEDAFLDDAVDESLCPECGFRRIVPRRVPQEKARRFRRPIQAVNGEFIVVSGEFRQTLLGSGLRGLRMLPFDDAGQLWVLTAVSSLGDLVLEEEYVLNLDSPCPACGGPRFGMFFGPRKYRRECWNGDDVVRCDFFQDLLFTSEARQFMERAATLIGKGGPVYLV